MGYYNHDLKVDATIIASKNYTIIGEHVVMILSYFTIATV